MSEARARVIAPGGVIGIVGGGQLGRMTAMAAARLGYRCHIFSPEADGPAAQVAHDQTIAGYDDADALAAFAKAVDVVTFEFENVPADSVALLAGMVPVRPSPHVLAVAQDRLREKSFFNEIGIPTAPWRAAHDAGELKAAVAEIGQPAVLKTTRLGYDGKGQVKIENGTDLGDAWRTMGAPVGILEGFIDFEREISVIVARGTDGAMACFDPVENIHVNHILDTTIAPAVLPDAVAREAIRIAERAARELDLVGLLAVEMFVTRNGGVLVNEMAPRPHNSGHWTIDACVTSEFEQFVRAVCGLPLGSPARHSDAEMKNLIGDDAAEWPAILHDPEAKLHLYGKADSRPGRKMGHVTRIFPRGSRRNGH